MFDSLKKKLKDFTSKAAEAELEDAPPASPAQKPPSAAAPSKAPASFEVVKKPAPTAPQAKPAQPAPASKPAPTPPPKPAKKTDDELEAELDAELEAELAEIEAEVEEEEAPKPAPKAPEPVKAPPPPAPKPAPTPAAKPAPTPPPATKPAPTPAAKPAPAPAAAKPATPAPKPPEPAPKAPAPQAPPAPPAPRRSIDERVQAALSRQGAASAELPIAPAKPPAAPEPQVAKPTAVAPPLPPPGSPVVAPKAPEPAPKAPTTPEAPKAPEGAKTINLEKIEDLLWDLEVSLLESDVAMSVVEEIKEKLKEHLGTIRVRSQDEVPEAVERALRQSILDVLSMDRIDFDSWLIERMMKKKPVVVMFVGVNGTGKTTAIGRIAHRLKEHGVTSVMAAGDTFRAGAIAQLEKHGERLGITVVKHQHGGDPAAVAYDAIEHAKARLKDVVLLDTAGRMQTNTNLMDEMKKIKRVAEPDLIVFVGDSLAGNDAVEQAQKFNAAVGLDACILTKVDTDAKGGAALSIAHAVGKPILFLGVGQDYGDLVAYDPEWMVNRIFES